MDVGIEKEQGTRPQNRVAIVFVHGFTGDRRRTWGHIPDFLQAEPRLAGWDFFFFGYSSNWLFDITGLWSADPDIEAISIKLATVPELAAYTKLAFVAHSMGGLAVQKALVSYPNLLKHTSHVVLFGTPSGGLDKAGKFKFWKRQIKNMSSSGQFIADLKREREKLQLDSVHPPFHFLAVAGEEDQFVPPESSLDPFPRELQAVIDGNHLTMLKAKSADAPCIKRIMQVLVGQAAESGARTAAHLAAERGEFQQVIDELWPVRVDLDDIGATRLALALDAEGRRDDAIQFLESHSRKGTDVLGVLAGRYKRRWLSKRSRSDGERATQLYRQAYDEAIRKDPVDHDQAYYHGINVAFFALAGEAVDRQKARSMAADVLQHCQQAQELKSELWRLATEGDALIILDQKEKAFHMHAAAARCQIDPWQALSIQEQSIGIADLCGLPAAEIKRLAEIYQGHVQ